VQNRNQKSIRRMDVRQLEKLGLLEVKKFHNNEGVVGKISAAPQTASRTARSSRWM
jgi:hypothetical protein